MKLIVAFVAVAIVVMTISLIRIHLPAMRKVRIQKGCCNQFQLVKKEDDGVVDDDDDDNDFNDDGEGLAIRPNCIQKIIEIKYVM